MKFQDQKIQDALKAGKTVFCDIDMPDSDKLLKEKDYRIKVIKALKTDGTKAAPNTADNLAYNQLIIKDNAFVYEELNEYQNLDGWYIEGEKPETTEEVKSKVKSKKS